MSSTYTPGNDWPEFTPQQAARIRREMNAIKQAWERDKPSERFTILHAEPARPRAGDLVYADGTDWDPGEGAGLYLRNEAGDAWVRAATEKRGTFTPVIEGATTAGAGTYSVQHGAYTLFGDRCFFNISLIWSAHTGTGAMRVSGLPFTSEAGSGRGPVSSYCSSLALTASHVLQPFVTSSVSYVSIDSYPSGGGAAVSVAIDTAGLLYLAGHYVIA